eukprot:2630355-Rhodomonas_salina.1
MTLTGGERRAVSRHVTTGHGLLVPPQEGRYSGPMSLRAQRLHVGAIGIFFIRAPFSLGGSSARD